MGGGHAAFEAVSGRLAKNVLDRKSAESAEFADQGNREVIVRVVGREKVAAVGHRVVHGGVQYAEPVLLNDMVLADLDALVPLHQPHNLAPIRAITAHAPDLPQVAASTPPSIARNRRWFAAEAKEAIALFVRRIVREIGSLAAAMGGIDGMVFTACIGENDAATRLEVMRGCGWLGVVPDEARNATGKNGQRRTLARPGVGDSDE